MTMSEVGPSGEQENQGAPAEGNLGEQWKQADQEELDGLKAKGDDATESEKARIAELEAKLAG